MRCSNATGHASCSMHFGMSCTTQHVLSTTSWQVVSVTSLIALVSGYGGYMRERALRRDFLLQQQLRTEREKSKTMLDNMLPPHITERLADAPPGTVIALCRVVEAITLFSPDRDLGSPGYNPMLQPLCNQPATLCFQPVTLCTQAAALRIQAPSWPTPSPPCRCSSLTSRTSRRSSPSSRPCSSSRSSTGCGPRLQVAARATTRTRAYNITCL